MILDAEGAIRSLRTVVFEKGADFTYERQASSSGLMVCMNFHGSEPGCIVGHVFGLLGLTAEKAEELGVAGSRSVLESAAMINRSDFEWQIGADAVEVLGAAQRVQDDGGTWGRALTVAEKEYATYAA